ncbi:MAG: hypothetical protein KA257_00625 [Opitutaceae bacterium]|nr:hypothetical protein [Opitutaceae bacterium]
MIEASEHFYQDDPQVGPADVRTRLRDVEYFFLGNGLIQAAVQWAPAGEGTPLGLLVMNPDRLRKKREALTMHAENGLAATQLQLSVAQQAFTAVAGRVQVAWSKSVQPVVTAKWAGGGVQVEEKFSCPTWRQPALCREVILRNPRKVRVRCVLTTGVGANVIHRRLTLAAGAKRTLWIGYTLATAADRVQVAWSSRLPQEVRCRSFWSGLARVKFGHDRLDHFFRAACRQLPVAVSRRGCIDGSIWQYNLEWLRDQSMVALALTLIGATGPATTIFDRLLTQFVTPEGDTLDSSEKRNPAEVELDQNGLLLCTLKDYVLWTGNVDLVRKHWAKIEAVAEFPLRAVFRHPASGLLCNTREFWERHAAHGIEPGLELIYQCYVALGLSAAAVLARLTGRAAQAQRWATEGARLKTALLEHPQFRMHDARGFIKRRAPDGRVQETITPTAGAQLPVEVPLGAAGPHSLNPDAASVLPIALGLIAPRSALARRTLQTTETLWNQAWSNGGYGRYHVTSEPDSPGGWPFASLFVARAAIEAGQDAKVWRVLHWLDSLPGAKAGTWFEFYGRRLAPPFPQVGIVVWNWAELIILYVQHFLGVRPGEHGLVIAPHLPKGLTGAQAGLQLGGRRLRLQVRRGQGGQADKITVNGRAWRGARTV